MQFIRIHRSAGATLAIVLAITAVSGSAASARVLEGPVHQAGQAALAVPHRVSPSEFRAVEAQAALAHSYKTSSTVHSAELDAHPKVAPTAAVPEPRLAAPSDSFQWGDAAIGAGVAVAIVSLLAAGTLVVRRRTQLGGA
jgi:hypothetical protein